MIICTPLKPSGVRLAAVRPPEERRRAVEVGALLSGLTGLVFVTGVVEDCRRLRGFAGGEGFTEDVSDGGCAVESAGEGGGGEAAD